MKTLYQFNLTPLVLDFQQGKTDEAAVLSQCALFIFRKLQKNIRLDEDFRQDFFLAFLPSVKKSLRTFSFQGVPFERYLLSVMKKRIISFFRSRRREWLYWKITADASFEPAYRAEETLSAHSLARLALVLGLHPADGTVRPLYRKWFLVWMLKHCRALERADIALTARLAGVDEAWVADRVAGLRAGLAPREQRLEALRRRRNRLFMLARVLELRVRDELDDGLKQAALITLNRKRRSLRNVMQAIARVGLCPSHRQIALETGIPKGTVDTIIARIKRILEEEILRRPARIA